MTDQHYTLPLDAFMERVNAITGRKFTKAARGNLSTYLQSIGLTGKQYRNCYPVEWLEKIREHSEAKQRKSDNR